MMITQVQLPSTFRPPVYSQLTTFKPSLIDSSWRLFETPRVRWTAMRSQSPFAFATLGEVNRPFCVQETLPGPGAVILQRGKSAISNQKKQKTTSKTSNIKSFILNHLEDQELKEHQEIKFFLAPKCPHLDGLGHHPSPPLGVIDLAWLRPDAKRMSTDKNGHKNSPDKNGNHVPICNQTKAVWNYHLCLAITQIPVHASLKYHEISMYVTSL